VSFEVEKGETVGIIGSNGAGKTTSLKLMSRITWPSSGNVTLSGRIAALIELGAGFHPELTGRENVFLNAAILGMDRSEVRREYDRIVEFAELERFMDTPVKRYSSGMFARLGFAVAAHVSPDVLLVDEVLAVGDVNFQRKCFAFIQDFVRSGKTTVFVSHNLFALEQLCDRLIWLDQGRVIAEGASSEILTAYMNEQDARLRRIERQVSTGDPIVIEHAEACDGTGQTREQFHFEEDVVIRLSYHTQQLIRRPHFVVSILDGATMQPLILASMLVDGQVPDYITGRGTLQCRFASPPLRPRTYHVWGEVHAEDRQSQLVRWQMLTAFSVVGDSSASGAGSLRHQRSDAPVRVDYQWLVE
jgi:lipopolysaccharide transport system ATP-binding protein